MKKKIIILLSIVLVIGIIAGVYYVNIPKISIDEKDIRLDLYDYVITEDDIKLFNEATSEELESGDSRLTGNKIDGNKENNKLFSVIYKVHFDRKSESDGYRISAEYKSDDRLEQYILQKDIFPEDPFHVEEGGEGIFVVVLTGVMPNYNEEELTEMVSKTKLTIYAQNQSNKKIKEFSVSYSDTEVNINKYSESEEGIDTIFDDLRENDD